MGLLGGRTKVKTTCPDWLREYLLDGKRPPHTHAEGVEMLLACEYAGELADVWRQYGPALLEEWGRRGRTGEPWAVLELRRQEEDRARARGWTPLDSAIQPIYNS